MCSVTLTPKLTFLIWPWPTGHLTPSWAPYINVSCPTQRIGVETSTAAAATVVTLQYNHNNHCNLNRIDSKRKRSCHNNSCTALYYRYRCHFIQSINSSYIQHQQQLVQLLPHPQKQQQHLQLLDRESHHQQQQQQHQQQQQQHHGQDCSHRAGPCSGKYKYF